MRRLTATTAPMLALLLVAMAGCEAAPYDERMKYLDEMSTRGIEYRGQLQKQGTAPSEKTCGIGFDLLRANPPDDTGAGPSSEWTAQVREAYVKSCMTGAARPKPDANGVKAVTPVPFTSSPAPAPSSQPH